MSFLAKTPLAAVLLAMACQNNTILLEDTDFGPADPTDDMTSGGRDPATTGGTTPTSDTLLLAINTIWSDTAFIQALVTSTPSSTGSTADIDMQFLSLDAGSNTSPRQPVGPVYSYTDVALDAGGGFVLDAGQITIVAAANPINGLDINTTLVLDARPDGAPLCGDVTGSVTMPVIAEFAGSTHGMTSVPGLDQLPVDVTASCP